MPIEENQDLDTGAALESISEELFGQGSEEGKNLAPVEGQGSGEQAPVASPDPQKQTSSEGELQAPVTQPSPGAETPPAENNLEVQDVGAPKTWTKEALAEWATIPPRAQQEILKREEDFMRGIETYKGRAEVGDAINAVIEPYRPVLAAQNIDPMQLFQAFASNHYNLTYGTQDQKDQVFANLVAHYRPDLNKVLALLGGQAPAPLDPNIQRLQTELTELKTNTHTREQQEREAALRNFEAQVNAFSSETDASGTLKYPHFQALGPSMASLIKSGLVPDGPDRLARAYDMALYNDPTLRQAELDRIATERLTALEAEKAAKLAEAQKAKGSAVKTSHQTRDGTVPKGSWEDTLMEKAAEIQGRA